MIFPVGGLYGQQAPVAWWSRPSSVPQWLTAPFRFLDRGYGTSCPKALRRHCYCQSTGVNWRYVTFTRNHILIFWFDISVDTFGGLCSDGSYLTDLKITQVNWTKSTNSFKAPTVSTSHRASTSTRWHFAFGAIHTSLFTEIGENKIERKLSLPTNSTYFAKLHCYLTRIS